MASYGYIVMSHENNTGPGINSASTTTLTPVALSYRLLDRAEQFRESVSFHGVGHGDFHDGGGSSVAQGPCLMAVPSPTP